MKKLFIFLTLLVFFGLNAMQESEILRIHMAMSLSESTLKDMQKDYKKAAGQNSLKAAGSFGVTGAGVLLMKLSIHPLVSVVGFLMVATGAVFVGKNTNTALENYSKRKSVEEMLRIKELYPETK